MTHLNIYPMHSQLKIKLKNQKHIEAEMIEAAFNYWFTDNLHIRSPFPFYIREQLKLESIERLIDWSNQISTQVKKELSDEIIAEKFEEIIFETALKLVLTEDEKITIHYPFMPRKGDKIKKKNNAGIEVYCIVEDRTYYKKGDESFLKINLINTNSGEKWETEFELPE